MRMLKPQPESELKATPTRGRDSQKPIVVLKFGGTSVGSAERIRNVANRALAEQAAGRRVVVVVSAMAGETNRLVALASQFCDAPSRRELDTVSATGEQVAIGLVALAILAGGGRAQSVLGHQVPILTDDEHGEARVVSVGTQLLHSLLDEGVIPVVAGFQGVTVAGAISTLGRGGSDTTAVAIAAALQADCEIFTDVDGVYTVDPGVCSDARLLPAVSTDAMLALARHGAKVLHPRCVSIAKHRDVEVHVRSSFSDRPGTVLRDADPLEQPTFVGVAMDRKIALIRAFAASELEALRVLAALADRQVSFETVSRDLGSSTLMISVSSAELNHATAALDDVGCSAEVISGISKVSLVGSGLASAPVLLRFAQLALVAEAIPLQITNDDVSIRCLLPDARASEFLHSIHTTFLAEPQARLSA